MDAILHNISGQSVRVGRLRVGEVDVFLYHNGGSVYIRAATRSYTTPRAFPPTGTERNLFVTTPDLITSVLCTYDKKNSLSSLYMLYYGF